MKKIIGYLLSAAICLSLFGCNSASENSDSFNIVCTIFPPYDFVRTLTEGQENVNVTLLLKAGQESHDYDPSSGDIASIHDCDMFIYVGGESDQWLDDILSTTDRENKTILAMMDMVDPLEEETVEGMEESEKSHGGLSLEEYDEHVWTSPKNAMEIVSQIAGALVSCPQIDETLLRQKESAYLDALSELDKEMEKTVDEGNKDTIVVADRFPFRYLCEDYGIEYFAAFPGCAASTEPSSTTLLFLTDKVKELSLPVVFKIEMSAANIADHIAKETGAKVLTLHSCHNRTVEEEQRNETYLSLMEQNVESLKEALN